MILFVFEGDEREPRLYRTLEKLYFPKVNDNIICSFGHNIYDLYNDRRNMKTAETLFLSCENVWLQEETLS